MKKLIYLFILGIGITSCSVESLDSTENFVTADAKFKIQQVEKSMNLKSPEICEGEAPVFVFNFPQNTTGNGVKDTDIQIQLYNPESGEWSQFKKLSFAGAGPVEYTYTDALLGIDTYEFRASIGSGGFDYVATLSVVECSECEESFTYVDNFNGTYTFTYIVGEDIADAELVFTFAQGSYKSGLSEEFSQNGNNGQTYKAIMDLNQCDILSYTVDLIANCSGNSTSSNVWTDFKVNNVSKKAGSEDKFVASCN